MAKNKRKSMAEDIHLKKLPRIDEDEEFVDTEPLSLPGQPLKFEKKNGLCFIVKKEYVKSRSKFFNRIHIHDSKLLLNQKQDKVNRFAVRVERCNASFLEFFSGPAVFRAVQSKAVALSYSQLLKDIQTAMQSQLAATQHLFKLLTRHMVVRRQKNVCLNEIDKQTADVDGDVNVEDLDLTDPRLISIFREKHQAMINLSREAVKKMNEIQDCFSVFHSCPTDFVSRTLLTIRVVPRYHKLLSEIDKARRSQKAGLVKIKDLLAPAQGEEQARVISQVVQ